MDLHAAPEVCGAKDRALVKNEELPFAARSVSICGNRTYHGQTGNNSACLICSIKDEVKRKHLPWGRKFSCFGAHLNEQDLF